MIVLIPIGVIVIAGSACVLVITRNVDRWRDN